MGHHASTNESESRTSIQANKENNSKTYDNEFGQNNINTGNVGNGGSVFLQDLQSHQLAISQFQDLHHASKESEADVRMLWKELTVDIAYINKKIQAMDKALKKIAPEKKEDHHKKHHKSTWDSSSSLNSVHGIAGVTQNFDPSGNMSITNGIHMGAGDGALNFY